MRNKLFRLLSLIPAFAIGTFCWGNTIAQNNGGPASNGVAGYFGQSFTTPSGGPFDDVTFNFYANFPPSTAVAIGAGYLLKQQYMGTPSDISSSAPGYLGSATASSGVYTFDPSLTLQANTQYFFYSNGRLAVGSVTGDNSYPGGQGYFVSNANIDYGSGFGLSNNFLVSGISLAPEPSALGLLIAALATTFVSTRFFRMSDR